MKIYIINRKNIQWGTEGAVAIVSESKEDAETLYRRNFDFEFDVEELEITNGLILEANGYDCTIMKVYEYDSLMRSKSPDN